MADNVTIDPGTSPSLVFGSDDISSVQYQRVKLIHGADGTNAGDVSSSNGLPITTQRASLTASSPTAATVGTSTGSAVSSNANRKGLVLVNTSANTISIGIGASAVLNSGITLAPTAAWVMNEFTFSTAQINAIASAGSSNLAIQEFT